MAQETFDERMAQYAVELAAFAAQHPHYCRACGGTGVVRSTENGAPHGAGYWPMEMEEFCPACVEEGRCPLCGAEIPEESYTMPNTPRCPACGWQDNKAGQPRAPEAPEPF